MTLIDKFNLTRTCLKRILDEEDDMKVTGKYIDIHDARGKLKSEDCNIIILYVQSLLDCDVKKMKQLKALNIPVLLLYTNLSGKYKYDKSVEIRCIHKLYHIGLSGILYSKESIETYKKVIRTIFIRRSYVHEDVAISLFDMLISVQS